MDLEGLPVVPRAVADLARDVDVGRKFISILMVPSPEQLSQRPPLTLNENRPGWYPRILASVVSAYSLRMLSNTPV